MIKWDDGFFDMDIREIKKLANAKTANRFIYVEHTWQQLKLPLSWYEEQCSLVSFDEEVIMREIDLKRIHGSSQSPFKRADILYLMQHTPQPIKKLDYTKKLLYIQIYQKIYFNKVYMMGIDPSEGLGQDNNAMTLVDPATGKIAAEFQCPYISQPDFCRMLCRFLDEYCPKSMIIIESNKGREMINCFLETKYRFNLYYDDGKLEKPVIEKTDPYGRLKMESTIRRSFGLWTGNNRSAYFGILENLMNESKNVLLSQYVVNDICGLIRKPNGRIEAGKGAHDDNIMSYLLCMFVYTQAPYEKLEEYGIRRGSFDNFNYTDADGNMTEEGTLRQLADMMDYLPENMRELIEGALQQRDPVRDAQQFYREVDRIRNRNDNEDPRRFIEQPEEVETDDIFTRAPAPMDNDEWLKIERQAFQANDVRDRYDPYGGSDDLSDFDIDDYF